MFDRYKLLVNMRAVKAPTAVEKISEIPPAGRPLSYAEAMALSLLKYSEKDSNFAKTLNDLISSHLNFFGAPVKIRDGIEILVPKDADTALKRAHWLMQAIKEDDILEAASAGATLTAWSKSRTWESPKQLVVGMIQVAIPGVTLGRFKIKRVMPIVIRNDITGSRDLELSSKISEATLGVINRALTMSGGNVHKIEPELGEWFYGEMELSFKSATESELTKIENELTDLGILHSTINKDGKPAVIAISPAVNTTPWNLKPLS